MSKSFKSIMSMVVLGLFVFSAVSVVEADDKLIVVDKNPTDQQRNISAAAVAPPTAQVEQPAVSSGLDGSQIPVAFGTQVVRIVSVVGSYIL